MAIKKQVNETAAADTLNPGAAPADTTKELRTEKLSSVIGALATVDSETLTKIFDEVMEKQKELGTGPGVGNVSDSNKATLTTKPSAATAATLAPAIKEDLVTIFGTNDLTEEFKEKTAIIFEAAVSSRAATLVTEAEEKMLEEVEEFKKAWIQEMSEKIESYIDYAADHFMTENEIAIENSLKVEMSEAFMADLKSVFENHYIDIPESEVNVVEALTSEIESAQSKLDEALAEIRVLKETVSNNSQESALAEISEGLTLSQSEKLKTLVEGISTDGSVEDFRKKAIVIKETYFPGNKTPSQKIFSPETLTEEVDGAAGGNQNNLENVDPQMRKYLETTSRLFVNK